MSKRCGGERWTGQRIAQQTAPEPSDGEPHPAPAEAEPDARSGAEACRSSATSTPRRAICCTSISRSLAASLRPRTASPATAATRSRAPAAEYVHVAIDDHSRIAFSAIYPDEKQRLGTALPACRRWPTTPRFGIQLQGCAHRQRPGIPLRAFAEACRAARPQAPLHSALYPTHQRQGRALHPDRATRMGLRSHLPELSTNAARSSLPGCTSTTGTGLMLASACRHPSAEQDSRTTTC